MISGGTSRSHQLMKILLGLSGGLDSTYSAKLLEREGHDVTCACLYFGRHTDVAQAERSASELGLPFTVIDCSDDFENFVVRNFVSEYASGRTPSPCTVCNRFVKVDSLYKKSVELGFDAFATGHYASVGKDPASGRYYVSKAADLRKDQSYMLWKLTQDQLSRFMTPLARFCKDGIREDAAALGLSSSGLKESQDICFIPRGESYVPFIENRIGKCAPGNYIDREGNILGAHKGIVNYTVGQRKGLGVALGRHMFITGIDADTGNITLSPESGTYASAVEISDLNYQKFEHTGGSAVLDVKIRYAAKPVRSEIEFRDGGALVTFENPVRTPAPGQSAVFYDGEDVMFGGVIEKVIY